MPLAIIALTIATFGIGTSEFVIMGYYQKSPMISGSVSLKPECWYQSMLWAWS